MDIADIIKLKQQEEKTLEYLKKQKLMFHRFDGSFAKYSDVFNYDVEEAIVKLNGFREAAVKFIAEASHTIDEHKKTIADKQRIISSLQRMEEQSERDLKNEAKRHFEEAAEGQAHKKACLK